MKQGWILVGLCFVLFTPVQGGTVDKLIGLLTQKGLITETEAAGLRAELVRETACTPEVTMELSAGEDGQVPQAPRFGQSAPAASDSGVTTVPAAAPDTGPASTGKDSMTISVGEKVRFGGDLRLRYDYQGRSFGSGQPDHDRGQPRFRLRFGFEAEPLENLEIGARFASGSGFQNTTNQSFDDHARGKQIFIDRAYASWKPHRAFTLVGGKQENPFFTTPLVWDEDVNIEGLSELLQWKGEQVGLFANVTQFVVEEVNNGTTALPWMVGAQVGISGKPADGVSVRFGATFYNFMNLDLLSPQGIGDSTTFVGYNQAYGQQMVFDNRGRLLNEFRDTEVNGTVTFQKVLPFPVEFFGAYLKNHAADITKLRVNGVAVPGSDPARLLAYGNDNRDAGYQFGVALGNRGHKKDVNVQYLYQALEDFAFPAVFVDSDFHGGGTNNRGHRLRVHYYFNNRIYFQNVLFFTQTGEHGERRPPGREPGPTRPDLQVLTTTGWGQGSPGRRPGGSAGLPARRWKAGEPRPG